MAKQPERKPGGLSPAAREKLANKDAAARAKRQVGEAESETTPHEKQEGWGARIRGWFKKDPEPKPATATPPAPAKPAASSAASTSEMDDSAVLDSIAPSKGKIEERIKAVFKNALATDVDVTASDRANHYEINLPERLLIATKPDESKQQAGKPEKLTEIGFTPGEWKKFQPTPLSTQWVVPKAAMDAWVAQQKELGKIPADVSSPTTDYLAELMQDNYGDAFRFVAIEAMGNDYLIRNIQSGTSRSVVFGEKPKDKAKPYPTASNLYTITVAEKRLEEIADAYEAKQVKTEKTQVVATVAAATPAQPPAVLQAPVAEPPAAAFEPAAPSDITAPAEPAAIPAPPPAPAAPAITHSPQAIAPAPAKEAAPVKPPADNKPASMPKIDREMVRIDLKTKMGLDLDLTQVHYNSTSRQYEITFMGNESERKKMSGFIEQFNAQNRTSMLPPQFKETDKNQWALTQEAFQTLAGNGWQKLVSDKRSEDIRTLEKLLLDKLYPVSTSPQRKEIKLVSSDNAYVAIGIPKDKTAESAGLASRMVTITPRVLVTLNEDDAHALVGIQPVQQVGK